MRFCLYAGVPPLFEEPLCQRIYTIKNRKSVSLRASIRVIRWGCFSGTSLSMCLHMRRTCMRTSARGTKRSLREYWRSLPASAVIRVETAPSCWDGISAGAGIWVCFKPHPSGVTGSRQEKQFFIFDKLSGKGFIKRSQGLLEAIGMRMSVQSICLAGFGL